MWEQDRARQRMESDFILGQTYYLVDPLYSFCLVQWLRTKQVGAQRLRPLSNQDRRLCGTPSVEISTFTISDTGQYPLASIPIRRLSKSHLRHHMLYFILHQTVSIRENSCSTPNATLGCWKQWQENDNNNKQKRTHCRIATHSRRNGTSTKRAYRGLLWPLGITNHPVANNS